MTSRKLRNIALPNQSSFEQDPNDGLATIQVVNNRLYTGNNKIAFKDEFSSLEETNPVYTYVNNELVRIDYASGNYKLFTYVFGNLTQLDYVKQGVTYRRVFNYNLSGDLSSIIYSVI